MEIDFYAQFPELIMLNHPAILDNFAKEKGFLTAIDVQVFFERRILTELLIKKRFNSKMSFSLKPRYIKEYIALGEVYSQLFVACEKLHSFNSNRYISAMHWWSLLVVERGIDNINCGSKKETIIHLKSNNRKLREYSNPIDDSFKHTWLLVEEILRFSQQNNIFYREVFMPLKKALSAWVSYYESRECSFLRVEGKEYFAVGNGGSLKKINKSLSLTEYENIRDKK